MYLVLQVGGKELERKEINPIEAKDEDYLQSLRRLMIIRHELSIIALQAAPEFFLEAQSKACE